MKTLWLYTSAPFAAFRPLQAGALRTTLPVMPPSAAWGLVLNIAGVETRGSLEGVCTTIRDDAPSLDLAIATVSSPELSSLYQQLHSYPVGNSGKERAARCHGAKYHIVPVRRQLLVNYKGVIGVRTKDDSLAERIQAGLGGAYNQERYGLPFAGDNSFMFDELRLLDEPMPCTWYVPQSSSGKRGAISLPIKIDRLDSSRTSCQRFVPLSDPTSQPPDAAWVTV